MMFSPVSSIFAEKLLSIAREHTNSERDAARLAEAAFQMVCADPDLLVNADVFAPLMQSIIVEMWGQEYGARTVD